MKTLVKPLVELNTEIYLNQARPHSRQKSQCLQYRKFHAKWKFLLITMSFFIFIVLPDVPEIDGNICNKFNNEKACNIW